MAIGNKKPVVMEFDKAVPNGVATLDEFGKLKNEQRPDYSISQVTELQEKLNEKAVKSEVDEHFQTLDSTTGTATKNIESLQSDMVTAKQDITQAKSDIQQAQTDITGLRSSKADATALTEGLAAKADKTQLTTEVNKLKGFEYVLDGAGPHNSIYRGQLLGESVTAEQYQAISSGKFTGLFIGDYWTINKINYRIAAFDYYYNVGDQNCTTHHVVLVADTSLYNYNMNTTNTTDGGWNGSEMYKTGLNSAKLTINSAFNGHVLSHRKFLLNTVKSGAVTGGIWESVTVDLMTEAQVYGANTLLARSTPTIFQWTHTVDKTQLPLFRFRPDLIGIRVNYWLQDVCSSVFFAYVNGYGDAACYYAAAVLGVRPAFCIS